MWGKKVCAKVHFSAYGLSVVKGVLMERLEKKL